MNPTYGILMWVIIGALAGWIGSKIMGTDAQQGGLANILFGIAGAVVGGFVTRHLFHSANNHGFIMSFVVALIGACAVIYAWKRISIARHHHGTLTK
jgi:uncharacterized membrane protein YeaQ/YmgE (transglycosylase-associated protein family)